jgi:hypothetical protein
MAKISHVFTSIQREAIATRREMALLHNYWTATQREVKLLYNYPTATPREVIATQRKGTLLQIEVEKL